MDSLPALAPPTREAAEDRLDAFVKKAGISYSTWRNYDFGNGNHGYVSTLSPYIRHRVLTEETVLRAVLDHHDAKSAEKFIQEVFWRTYWKGWLEHRPAVWPHYRAEICQGMNLLRAQTGLRQQWERACQGQTGILCFDTWVQELVQTGYLHNHTRMWFASIWVFTLRLPWALGADFFLRHLLDGDVASNTLSWRWVAGRQTLGKAYRADAQNIATYTNGRFFPQNQLNEAFAPTDLAPHPPPTALRQPESVQSNMRTAVLWHDDDMDMGALHTTLAHRSITPLGQIAFSSPTGLTPLPLSSNVIKFRKALFRNDKTFDGPIVDQVQGILDWAISQNITQLVTPYACVGPVAEALAQLRMAGLAIAEIQSPYDTRAWPHATKGFFAFKKQIPKLVLALDQPELPFPQTARTPADVHQNRSTT